MNFWQRLGDGFFTGERSWAWRRRMVFAGCAVYLAGVVNSIWFDHDFAHATMIMNSCSIGFGATLATYVTLAVADDKFKRDSNVAANTPVTPSKGG